MATDVVETAAKPTKSRRRATKKKPAESTAASTPDRSGDDRPLAFEAWGVLAIAGAVLLLLSLVTYQPALPDGTAASSWIGTFGVVFADLMYFTIGIGAFFVVALAFAAARSLMIGRRVFAGTGEASGYLLTLLASASFSDIVSGEMTWAGHEAGGWVGALIGGWLIAAVGTVGGVVVTVALLVVSTMLVTRQSLVALVEGVWHRLSTGSVDLRAAWSDHARRVDAARTERAARRAARRAEQQTARAAALEAAVAAREAADAAATAAEDAVSAADAVPTPADEPVADAAPTPVAAPRVGLGAKLRSLFSRQRMPAVTPADVTAVADAAETTGVTGADVPRLAGTHTDPPWVEDFVLDGHEPVRTGEFEVVDTTLEESADGAAPTVIVGGPEPAAGSKTSASTPPPAPKTPASAASGAPAPVAEVDHEDIGPVIVESEALKRRPRAADLDRAQQQRLQLGAGSSGWELPPMSYLSYEESDGSHIDREQLRELAARLEDVLSSFKVKGQVSGICPGPVVTRFEFEPESGTKLSKISNLSDDIAMALKAHKVRIIAPIPGKGCVGIEVPNDRREIVYLKEIIADDKFTKASKNKLTVALGKDIEGFPVVADLAKMPHLLVAGTTGSGKSVSVNAMITSILYNASPDDVRMIMIDPKQLEFAIYKDIPHLLLPVVTDPARAATALQWAVQDMERRYKLMAELRVRNITGYNKKLAELRAEYDDLGPDDPAIEDKRFAPLHAMDPDGRPSHRRMFYLVVVVDEFADLMMVAGKEVEMAVARLAQKARAAGIHVILATQRPSVDVITGLIKSNFPTRMSFRLMSGTDSRTVLDTTGAENLLGMGDMLFRPPGRSDLVRVHGAYVDEKEIEQIAEFLKAQRMPEYDESILAEPESDGGDSDEPVDELYDEAVAAVIEAGFASISSVQRKLRIGYNRSARMVEEMERQGVIGPATGGSSRREVLVGRAYADMAP